MVVFSIDWTTVIVAGVTAIPATIAAVAALGIRRQVATANGASLGQLADRSIGVADASHAILRKQNGGHEELEED